MVPARDGAAVIEPQDWPCGVPEQHEECCLLHEGGEFCDCKASAADDVDWGECL